MPWNGRTGRDLVEAEGPPDRVTSDEASGRIFVYDKSRTNYYSRWSPDPIDPDIPWPNEIEDIIMYWISSDGIIYRGLWRIGNSERSYQVEF